MKRSIRQLRAISRSYSEKNKSKAANLVNDCNKLGLSFKTYNSAAWQIRECEKVLSDYHGLRK